MSIATLRSSMPVMASPRLNQGFRRVTQGYTLSDTQPDHVGKQASLEIP